MSQFYIIIAIIFLAIIAGLVIFIKKTKPETRLSPFTALAFAFVIAGIVFGENRIAGYSLMGIGVLIALIDAIRKSKK